VAARDQPLIIAGATGYGAFPPNSLEGARACLAAPVDGIEIDVQLTADGHVVAHHDYRLDPDMTRKDGDWLSEPGPPIKTLPLDALRAYDLGRARPGSREARHHAERQGLDGVRVPTLPVLLEALKAVEGPRRWIYIEIKTDPTNPDVSPDPFAVTEAVLRDVEAADYADRTKIIAFDWQVLRLVAARRPGLATAHLTIPARYLGGAEAEGERAWWDQCDPPDFAGSTLAAIRAHGGMEWSPYYTDVTAEKLAEAAGLGLRVGPWGLSKAEDVARMIALGVYSATVSGPDWAR
jgi:glycerophosphoryl diester phosphodiesterase